MNTDIPTISITTQCKNIETLNYEHDIKDTYTDIEDFDSNDEDTSCTNIIITAQKSSTKLISPAVTDIEDYCDSDLEEEISTTIPEVTIPLKEYLDQGFTEENTKLANDITSKSGSKVIEGNFINHLSLELNESDCKTDCENIDASDDENGIYQEFINYNKEQKNFDITSSEMIEDITTTTEYKENETNENELEEDKEGACCLSNIISEADDITVSEDGFEIDEDENQNQKYPIIDITFVSDQKTYKRKFINRSCTHSPNLDVSENIEDPLTDVERLASDDDTSIESDISSSHAIPRARASISSITDIEDLEVSNIGDLLSELKQNEVDNQNLPEPVREMVLVKEDDCGDPVAKIIPLTENIQYLSINTLTTDKDVTDIEEISDVEYDYYELVNAPTVEIPIVEHAIVQNCENIKTHHAKKCEFEDEEPLTEIEEFFEAGTVRRKKTKTKTHIQKQKSKYLSVTQNTEQVKTDVEELEISDYGQKINIASTKEQRQVSTNRSSSPELMTEFEYVTGEEDNYTSDAEQKSDGIIEKQEQFQSSVSTIEALIKQGGKIDKKPSFMIRRRIFETEPDSVCTTDIEDIQLASDADENPFIGTYLMAETISPIEVQEILIDSVSVVHEKCSNLFNVDKERNFIKGMNDYNETNTDIEYFDEEIAVGGEDKSICNTINLKKEEIADAKKDDLYDEKYSPVHTKEDIELIREEAIILIDNILEESIMIINAQQCNNDYNSESEQYAITCDVNGIDMVKSPTIESLSGKSFDDNMSVNDELNVVPYNINTTTISTISYSSITSTPYIVNDIITTTTTTNTIMQATTSSVNDNNLVNNKLKNKQIENEITISTDTSKNNIKNSYKIDDENNDNNINEKLKYSQNNYDRIEKKFERLSSQLDENDITENVENFDNNFDNIINKDEISNLQSDFSKISWDESISGTTTAADIGLSTPDNDLQDLPTEPGSQTAPIETDLVPKPTPRLSITSVASDISHKQSEIISTEAKILEESKTESRVDEDVDFKQSKKFWESLESSQSDAQAPMPVPKPRSQIKSQLSEVQKADDSIGSAKSSSQSKISSEQQVEYSETSSVRTSFKEDDSELSDGKIELEEDVVQIQEKPEKEKQTEGENGGAAVGFYIGESSTNIITKSSTERRQEFAFDNEGYEGTFDEDRDIDELAYDEKQTDVEKSEVLVKTTAQESHEIAVASSKESFQSSAAKRQIEPEQKDETNIEESSRIQEYEIIELEDLERRKSETKVVRQPSETRNDILECEYDVGKPSEKEISKSMKDDETKEKKVDQPLKSEFVIHNMCYEDQTLPILQEAIKEDINMYTSEIIKNQVYQVKEQGFEEKSHIITKQAYGFDDIVGDQIHVETEKEKVFLARATEVTEEDKNKISIDKTSSVIIETDTENTFERDQMEHKEELQKQKESKTEKTKTFEEEQNKIMKEDKLLMEMVSTESTSAVEQTTIRKDQSEKTESRVKFEPKLDLNLEKSEIELSEKRFTKTAIKEEQISQKDDFRKTLLIDPSQVDQTMVEQTLAEVKESLDAVQEELIEVVKDGKLIKESPSEFEFKILPHVRYTTNDPIQESFQEEALSIDKYSKSEITDDKTEKTEATDTSRTDDYPSLSSIEDTSSKLEVVHRIKKDAKIDLTKRWSVPEPEESSSGDSHYRSFEKTDSRPLSSDVENLITLGGSSEYQTAQDASLFPESTEYVSAVSTLDHSGKTISSHESMKSFDSESSANLGSIEISEMSETLVPSTADADIVAEIQEEEFEFGVLMEDYQTSEVPSQMKRSHEMTFKQEVVGQTQATESPDVTEDKDDSDIVRKLSTSLEESRIIDESKFATSLEEGSVLSMSLSSTSYVDTVVENVEDLASSLGASSLAGADIQTLIRDDYISSSFDEHSKPEKVGGIFITSSMDKDDDINNETTTNIVSTTEIMDSEPKRSKGHKRTESTSFSSSDFLKEIETTKSKSGYESPLEEELIDVKPKHNEEKKESESESDYDAYESEYSRAYKTPTTQKKSKKKHSEVFEKDQEPEKRPFTPSQLISETIIEDATEEIESLKIEEERRPSQNMQDYSNIPDITITEDQQKYVVEEPEDEEVQDFEEKVLYKVKTQEELHKTDDTPIYYAKEQEYTVPEDRYQELIQQQYDANVADITKYGTAQEEEKADSPDSFEMLEQPDISDEFVIIEEVAKEADEFDTEGKSINIKNVKYVKRHDEEVEQILVKSAPADPNQGSAMYMRDDINFDFEESPPMASDQEGAETSDAAIANKKWVEMQLSDNASHLRYPYEMERGVLEDIKEEDTEFEVGSSRISSFKDSFSSTPEYDVLAGRKYFTREHDDVSMSSLQEFESLEQAISLENRKAHQGSQDSLSNGSFTKRYKAARHGQGDDISLSSLKEFEGLENACIEAHLIEIRAKEEAALLLSRSDESNKSSSGDEKVTAKPSLSATTTVVTTVKTTSTPSQILETKTTVMTQREIEALIKAKLEECEEESSNLMEVSTDSLELGLKKSKSINGSDKKGSGHGSCDSLEINKSNDNMTSSIDSFEISKDATGRSSRSEVDSLEQQLQLETRRDSVDSIELEQVLQMTKAELELPNDPKDQKTTTTTTTRIMQAQGPSSNTVVTKTVTVTSTTTAPSTQQQLIQKPNEEMTKDISSDSLNLHQMDPEQLLTSTESLDLHTSSTATNATYQNENDSLMSSSMTSCGSSTMIETLDSNFAEMFNYGTVTSSRTSPFLMHDEKFLQQQQPFQIATNVTETSSTTSTIRTQSKDDDGDKRTFEYFETYEKGSDKTDTFKSKTGEEATAEPKPEEKKK